MDGIQMEPIGKYKADRNGSAKAAAAWRNMVDQDLDDVAFLADSEKAREARDLRPPLAVCSQRRALCLTLLTLATLFAVSLIIVYAAPNVDCPCMENATQPAETTEAEDEEAAANKERISTSGAVFPWRGARLPNFMFPKHYSLWLHPNLTTGELRGEVSIDFKVDRDTTFVVLNARDMNITERALFKSGGSAGPKVARALDYPPADQTYIEFKDKLRRKYNYTLSLRFITKLDRSDSQRGFYIAGTHKNRCAVSRFWLTHARAAFPCLDEPHFRASFRLTIVRDRFHVSLTNMPIVATEEAGFYLGHRLLQDEFASSPPMSPHMMSVTVCRLQRRAAPRLQPEQPPGEESDAAREPEISLYSDQQVILDEGEQLLNWVKLTLETFAHELNTSYPLPKLDIAVVEGASAAEGWGLVLLSPAALDDRKAIARLLAQQWFGGLVSPRWWSSQWLLSALTSVLVESAPRAELRARDALLLDHVLPALRLDSSASARAVSSPRLDKADIESATDELSVHKGAALVSMAVWASGRAALARLVRAHAGGVADARELLALLRPRVWDRWADAPGYPLLTPAADGGAVVLRQERFLMTADPPEEESSSSNDLLTYDLRADLAALFYEPENVTDLIEDENSTTTTPAPTTTTTARPTRPPPASVWVVPVTFIVGPLKEEYVDENVTVNVSSPDFTLKNDHWYEVGNETKSMKGSRWAQNVTHLIWMNETQMVVPDLGKHKWVRYNVGGRGLYRVAYDTDAEALWSVSSEGERAHRLDDLFVLSRARQLPPRLALKAHERLRGAGAGGVAGAGSAWRAAGPHVAAWRALLRESAAGPAYARLLRRLHPPRWTPAPGDENAWLNGALLTAGVEWGNEHVTRLAEQMFDDWLSRNASIPPQYQEAVFTAGVRRGGGAWAAAWRALSASLAALRPLYDHQALLHALGSSTDDWLFYRFAWTVLSPEAQKGRDWKLWVTSLCTSACRWRGPQAAWRVLRALPRPAPRAALRAAAGCLRHAHDYHQFKQLFGVNRVSQPALDIIALNAAWVPVAEADLLKYFEETAPDSAGGSG